MRTQREIAEIFSPAIERSCTEGTALPKRFRSLINCLLLRGITWATGWAAGLPVMQM